MSVTPHLPPRKPCGSLTGRPDSRLTIGRRRATAAFYWLLRAVRHTGGGRRCPSPPPSSSSQPLASHRAPRPCGARPCSRVEPPPPPPPQLEASTPGPSAPLHVGLQHRRPPARPAASCRRRRRSRGCGRRPSAWPAGRGRPGRWRPRRWRPRWRRRVRGPFAASRWWRPGDPQGRLRRRRAAGPPGEEAAKARARAGEGAAARAGSREGHVGGGLGAGSLGPPRYEGDPLRASG